MKYLIYILSCLTCAAQGTYYLDAVNGKNYPTNNGTSTSTPWQYHPYSKLGVLTGYTHVAGDRFIYKGGVVVPEKDFPLVPQNGGSSLSVQDYYGIDGSWGTGKAIFDDQLVGANSSAGSLDQMLNNKFINMDSANFTTISGIIITNLNWANHSNLVYCIETANNFITVTNCDFLCYSNLTGGIGSDLLILNYGSTVGSHATVTHCTGTCLPSTQYSGAFCYYINDMNNCVIHDMPNAYEGIATNVSYNVIYNIQHSVATDNHENCIEVFPIQDGFCNVTHNWVTNCHTGTIIAAENLNVLTNHTTTLNIFDNILGNNSGTLTPAIAIGGKPSAEVGNGICGVANIINNLIQDGLGAGSSQAYIRVSGTPDYSQWAKINATNNYFITQASGLAQLDSGCTTTISENHELVQNNAIAASYGATTNNSWQPLINTSPTINAGVSQTAFMLSIGLPNVDMAFNNFTNDIGAFQFLGTNSPIVMAGITIKKGNSMVIKKKSNGVIIKHP